MLATIRVMKTTSQSRIPLTCLSLCLAYSFFLSSAGAGGSVEIARLQLRDTAGKPIQPQPAKLTVYCFLGTQCPLARLYGPRLQRLADQFADKNVVFIGVNSNIQDSPAEIDAYATEHSIRFAIAKDADQSIAKTLGATRTPEVIVVNASGVTVYQGRIDDQYQPGIARAEPTHHDLLEAITSVLAGKNVASPRTDAVGCLISRIKTTPVKESEATITFTRDIAPILNQHCVECHREGEIGPFALTDYDEVVGWGPMMLEVIDQKRMPPWHADPAIGHFIDARTMPGEARDRIAQWIDEGMPEGDTSDLPDTPEWPRGWHMQTNPDVEIAMRERPFRVPEDGVVEYQYFVVDPKWDEDRWLRAAQVIPGDASVVHHAIVFVRPPDGTNHDGIGWLGAYVPGQRSGMLPLGHGRRIPAGSKIVFQLHYTPNGKVAEDITRVGVWFADANSITHEVVTHFAIDNDFEIPPGDEDYKVHLSKRSFPRQSRLLGATPHMHLRGKSFIMSATKSNGESEPLLHVPKYDFNWQHWYAFTEPIELDELKSLEMTIAFDNSDNNPFNPAPNEYVSWGDQTWEEMAIAFFDVASPLGTINQNSRRRPRRSFLPSDEEIARRKNRVEQHVESFLKKMDANGDGEVTREETPVTLRRNGFRSLDHNRDGRISRDEVRASAEQRL